jgi:hypothetical protein
MRCALRPASAWFCPGERKGVISVTAPSSVPRGVEKQKSLSIGTISEVGELLCGGGECRPGYWGNRTRQAAPTGRDGGERERGLGWDNQKLTRKSVDALGEGGLVAARYGAEGFVAHGEEDDGDEGEDKGAGGADVPLAEDNAQVRGIPCEEHL